MIKERAWPAKAMYILIAAALVMSFIITGVFTQKVSADPGLSEWTRVTTPTIDDWLMAPQSDIIDFAVGDGGDVAYAIVDSSYDMDGDAVPDGYCLLKSTDGAATWKDITDAIEDEAGDGVSFTLLKVATDGVDADFVAVALDIAVTTVHVFISDDGGDTFVDTGAIPAFNDPARVFELEVSPEVAGERDLAIGGSDAGTAELWRSTATGDSATVWDNATLYGGWDDEYAPNPPAFISRGVVDIKFAPSWSADHTILVATADLTSVRLQFGTWGTSEGWNLDSILAINAVTVVGGVGISIPGGTLGGATAGITLPLDYSGRNSDKRYAWVNVNYIDTAGPTAVGKIFRVKNKSVMEVNQQIDGTPWLTNVHYLGYIAEGKAIAGLLGDGTAVGQTPQLAACCEGVDVYRNTQITNMDICCLPWEEACKPPTGQLAMEAFFVSADKAYAVALGPTATSFEEGAWSVSFDDGDVWNQLSLVDTYIHYFSDVAVSPDCNKTWVVSVNMYTEVGCACDSVWLYGDDLPEFGYSEYSEHWIRVWHGLLEGTAWGDGSYEAGMLRLNPEETAGDTVYLFDYMTDNVYWNEVEGLACWDFGSASVDGIVDLAVLDKETIYALDNNGDVAMSDDFAIGWQEEVDSEVANGYTIAVWGDYVLVGGEDGDVAYSDDGGETFTALEDVATGGYVTVAFDTYFDANDVIYAALAEAPGNENGIYQWVIGESEDWTDLKAEPLESQLAVNDGDAYDERVEVNFTGLVVDRPGNPYTSADNGGVIYASYYGSVTANMTTIGFTGAARSLERTVEVCTTCLTWDFLYVGLTVDVEGFEAWPDALKICGCLTPDSNTHLFAIDAWNDYDFVDNEAGSVWTFEDCYAKKAPELTYPDGEVIPADPCSCYSVPFTLLWDTLCDACYYEIEFALDEDFTMPVKVNGGDETSFVVTGDVPSYSIMGGPEGGLSCEQTYYWRVRASKAVTEQIIHSWWAGGSFTVAPSIEAAQITLVAPEPGAMSVGTKNVGFSWDLLAEADEFDWVLSKNSDLSSPVQEKEGLSNTATTYTGTLDYGTTYYWKVTAYSEGSVISTSPTGSFTTAPTGAFCCPLDGLCFDTEAELEAHNAEAHPTQPVTPFWVWVVIGIGAALVIVVIVLIFRTRRV